MLKYITAILLLYLIAADADACFGKLRQRIQERRQGTQGQQSYQPQQPVDPSQTQGTYGYGTPVYGTPVYGQPTYGTPVYGPPIRGGCPNGQCPVIPSGARLQSSAGTSCGCTPERNCGSPSCPVAGGRGGCPCVVSNAPAAVVSNAPETQLVAGR